MIFPIEEALEIINKCKKYSTVVLSSGIVVDKHILKRIKKFPNDFKYEQAPLMECLENDISVKYVDVSAELSKINELCNENKIPFFQHSMPAIQYVKRLKRTR